MLIFISYRRQDTRYQARFIRDAFVRRVGAENVFMDVDSIPLGVNYRKFLKEWVDRCDVLLALIGPDWIDVTNPDTGIRRLEDINDFVRIEIAEALARQIPVVPVLLDGARLPMADQLPDDLKELCERQAEYVEYRTFDEDVERLIKKLQLQQAVPLRRNEARSTNRTRTSHADYTRFDIRIDGKEYTSMPKRRAIFTICQYLCEKGTTPEEIAKSINFPMNRLWYSIDDSADTAEFTKRSSIFDPVRWFCANEELVQSNGKTYAFRN
ncbi:MAG: toll/interleukin-1 receptor domain-containing protein, partial [Terriglobales bacterium]